MKLRGSWHRRPNSVPAAPCRNAGSAPGIGILQAIDRHKSAPLYCFFALGRRIASVPRVISARRIAVLQYGPPPELPKTPRTEQEHGGSLRPQENDEQR